MTIWVVAILIRDNGEYNADSVQSMFTPLRGSTILFNMEIPSILDKKRPYPHLLEVP